MKIGSSYFKRFTSVEVCFVSVHQIYRFVSVLHNIASRFKLCARKSLSTTTTLKNTMRQMETSMGSTMMKSTQTTKRAPGKMQSRQHTSLVSLQDVFITS